MEAIEVLKVVPPSAVTATGTRLPRPKAATISS